MSLLRKTSQVTFQGTTDYEKGRMNITQITVSVHEKRNNPYEYGHYDTELRVTADVDPMDDPNRVADSLIRESRVYVKDECGRWVAALKEERRVDALIGNVERDLHRVVYLSRDAEALAFNVAEAEEAIGKLPEHIRPDFREKLTSATESAHARINRAPQGDGEQEAEDAVEEEEEL